MSSPKSRSDAVLETHPSAIAELRRLLDRARTAVLRPPPRMNVPDWADTYRRLSTSAGAVGGKWETNRVEVARGPLMAVTEPGVATLSAECCTQVLKTELMLNTIGFFAHLDPAPLLLLQPKDEMADAFSKERITPMIQSSPALGEIMSDPRTRNGDDTLRFKRFPGGFLAISSAGSPSNLAMRAIRVVMMDEIDKYEPTKEGDPIALAEERTSTFMASALSIRACSPTWEETSRIHKSYLEGDQRRAYIACPHCGDWMTLDFFKHVLWDKTSDGEHVTGTACIYCEHCGSEITEAERQRIMTTKHAIQHRQTRSFEHCGVRQDPQVEQLWDWNEERQVGYAKCKVCGEHAVSNAHASFQVSKLYSPFTTVVSLAKKFIDTKDDPETRQTFYNTQLGLPYKLEVSKEVTSHFLVERREVYQAPVPEGGLVITVGLDVQTGSGGDSGRIEAETVAWGLGEESWSLGTMIFDGDPSRAEIWTAVDSYLMRPWRHQFGFDMYPMAACIDSGGHYTQDVYNFARARTGRNVWAIKGASDGQTWSPVWPVSLKVEQRHERIRAGFKPTIIGVNAAKESIRQRLLVATPGPAYCHFPIDRSVAWFEQLTSEKLVLVRKSGAPYRMWKAKKGYANEALDERVYAYAALQGLYATRRFNMAQQYETIMSYAAQQPDEAPVSRRRVRPNSWVNG